ncbi:MAG: B12-binding domain-containing radical SAM protein [Flammeovirgaceae bacterium]
MSKLLFANTFFYKLDAKQWQIKEPYPPLGTLYAAAVMQQHAHEVNVFDTNLKDSPTEIQPILTQFNPHYFIIYDDGFNYLTKMCLTVMREAAFQMIKRAKAQGCTVLISSSDSSDHYQTYLEEGADIVLIGEAEDTLQEVIQALEAKDRSLSSIKGLAYLENNEVQFTGKRPVIRQLDALPRPAWELVDLAPYRTIWLEKHGYFSLNLGTTRGCPFKCNWCAKPIYGNRYNSHSPERIVADIDYLITRYQVDHFWMCDDIFGLKPGWVQQFNALVQDRKLQFSYKIQSRADLLLEADTIQALAASGLDTVWIGAESGSQRILDAMDKGTTLTQISDATKLLKQHGIKVAFFLQFGYLDEQKEDIQKTVQMVRRLAPDYIGVSVSYPLPGTKFYEKVKTDLTLKANWSDSDDLDMMFHNTFQPNYYRKLHRYIHQVHRKTKAKSGFKRGSAYKTFFKSLIQLPYHTLGEFYYAIQMKQFEKPKLQS